MMYWNKLGLFTELNFAGFKTTVTLYRLDFTSECYLQLSKQNLNYEWTSISFQTKLINFERAEI